MTNDYDEVEGGNRTSFVWRILKFLWAVFRSYLMGVGFFFTVLLLLLTLLVMRTLSSGSESSTNARSESTYLNTVPEAAILYVRLDGSLTEDSPSLEDQLLHKFFGGPRVTVLADVRTALRRAAADARVQMAYVEVQNLQASKVDIAALRRSLKEFRASGKPVSMWLSELDTDLLYLASVADQVSATPGTSAMTTGPVFQLMYVGEALQKLGVHLEVLRAGKYKSVFESLTTNAPSPETEEMYKTMEASMRTHYTQEIASASSKPLEQVQKWFKLGVHAPSRLIEEGMIGSFQYADQFSDEISKNTKEVSGKSASGLIKLNEYLLATSNDEAKAIDKSGKGIALIEARGEIVGLNNGSGDDGIDPTTMKKELEWAGKTSDVAAVVLRIDSPGGSAIASDMIWHDVEKLTEKKPVIVSMASVAASGGYYIAAPATKIVAEAMSITGSIGVIGAVPKVSAFKEKYGVSFFVITDTDRANLLNPGAPSSDLDKALVSGSIQETYDLFLERVSKGRKIPKERVDEIAQGRVYTGSQALDLGLVDELGGLNESLQRAKELGGLDVKKLYPILRYEGEEMSLRECLRNVSNYFDCIAMLDTKSLWRKGKSALMQSGNLGMEAFDRQAIRTKGLLERISSYVNRREPMALLIPPFLH